MSAPASYLRTPETRLREDRVASVLGAEALAGAVPDLFHNDIDEFGIGSILSRGFALGEDMVRFKTRDTQQIEPSSARGHAELLITSRLRNKAAAIRSGAEPPALPFAQPEPDRRVQERPAERHVLFLNKVRYTGRSGQPVLCDAWTARVPLPVAEAAIKQGLAMDADTDAAREKMKEMMEHRPRRGLGAAVSIEDTMISA